MKKFLALTLVFVFVSIFAQTEIYFGKKKFTDAEITLENGTQLTGLLEDFKTPRFIETGLTSLAGLEKTFKYDTKEFKFKEKTGSALKIIKIEDLKRITLLNVDGSEKLIYDKVKLRTVNTKGEVIDLNKTVVLPLVNEGKLSLYGFSMAAFGRSSPYSTGPANQYLTTIFIPYLKNSNSEYAYLPFDVNRMNPFNLGSLDKKFKVAVTEVTNDCPEYQSNIDEMMELFEKKLTKEDKKPYYEKEDKKKKIRKTVKDKELENFLQMKIDAEYGMQGYLKITNDYNAKCSK